MSTTPAVQTEHLRKVFGKQAAVEDLSLHVRRGEVFGLLGPNGAGKSTLLKMLLGLVFPTAGHAELLGQPIGSAPVRARVGFLPEHLQFYDWMTGDEFLDFHGKLYEIPAAVRRTRVNELLELVELTPHRRKHLHDFSKGMLQRIGLAQALLNDPELIFLDEPTSGLDPIGRILVRDIIREQQRRGRTVFLNSHLLSEVEVTCDRVAFIKQGRVVATHELANGKAPGARRSVTARVRGATPQVLECLRRWCDTAALAGEELQLSVREEASLPEIVRYLVASGVDVFAFQSRQDSLEDMFLRIIGNQGGL